MSISKKIIVWEKWVDPFFGEEEDTFDQIDDEGEESNYEDEDIIPGEIFDNMIKKEINQQKNTQIKVISTPMGIVPINEYTASSKIFNFWTGHTNFSITPNIANIIESVDGVETLDIFTRYRFRIAIGKIFNSGEVMNKVSSSIYSHLEE
jgi:hypothetical protein